MRNKLSKLEKTIKFKFIDLKKMELALTHKSFAVEKGRRDYNERLEYLGDSIISAVIADHLYHRYPKDDEGKLSRLKAQLVSRVALCIWAKELDLGEYIFLSQGEEQSGGRTRDSILGNAFEALVGGMYLDQGYEKVRRFILRRTSARKRIVETDYKSRMQELVQKKYQMIPEYRIANESGPDHDKVFTIEVLVKKKVLGCGVGRNKKIAQQNAAKEALKKIKIKNKKSKK